MRDVAPRRLLAIFEHLVGRRSQFIAQTRLANRMMPIPRIAVMVREKMQIDGPLIAVPNGDSQKRLRSKRNMVRLEFLICREQQTVHLPYIADAVFLLVLG